MPEKLAPASTGMSSMSGHNSKDPVCIHTRKIYDACRDKDCLEDLRVYLTRESQCAVDKAINVKCRKAELIWAFIDVEEVSFNRGFYTVDVKYFFRVTADAFCGVGRPFEVTGLATFDKRVILFGSEGNAKIFSSTAQLGSANELVVRRANMPIAVLEAVDPICLNVKLVEKCHSHRYDDMCELPCGINEFFDGELVLDGDNKRLYCTLGQFSIIRLERDTQLVVPCLDFCMPEKECQGSTDDNPCDLFRRIKFPVDEFFPPSGKTGGLEDYRDAKRECGK